MSDLLRAVRVHSRISDSVIVSFSGGKDSVVTLDLCSKYFKKVHAFFMYVVPDLSFQTEMIQWAENRYGLKILQVPHFSAYSMKRNGVWCRSNPHIQEKSIDDIYADVRNYFDCEWIAAGERICDSLWRRAQIKQSGSVNLKRRRFFPVADFTKADILNYIRINRLKFAPESEKLGGSFQLMPQKVALLKLYYPDDYARIKAYFPFIDGSLAYSMQKNDLKSL